MTPKWLIDRVPDEDLTRLQPRPMSFSFVKSRWIIGDISYADLRRMGARCLMTTWDWLVLVSLRDCAPYLGMWPPDFDELVAVATRLLLVPGGPLILEDGETTRLRCSDYRRTAFGRDRIHAMEPGLACHTVDMVRRDSDVPQYISRAHLAGLRRLVRREMERYFLSRDDGMLEMHCARLPELMRPRIDPMLAGLPEGGEP